MKTQSFLMRALCVVFAAYIASRYYDNYQSTRGHPFKIVERRGRGKGLVATRDIAQGDLIIKEPPLFLVYAGSSRDPAKEVKAAVSTLNSTSRTIYYSLSHPLPQEDPKIPIAIFQTNSIRINKEAAGIFPLTSRINHGCSSAINSVPSWRKEGVLVVHALKPIKKGQVCHNRDATFRSQLKMYTSGTFEWLYRHQTIPDQTTYRAALFETYGFHCSCSVCSLPPGDSRRSDKLISSMNLVEENLQTWEKRKLNGIEAVRIAKSIWAIGEKEGYWLGRGKLAEYVVKVAAAHDDEKAAKAWAELAEEWYAYEFGEDSEEVERMAMISSEPSKHSAWGTREPLRVGDTDMDLM